MNTTAYRFRSAKWSDIDHNMNDDYIQQMNISFDKNCTVAPHAGNLNTLKETCTLQVIEQVLITK